MGRIISRSVSVEEIKTFPNLQCLCLGEAYGRSSSQTNKLEHVDIFLIPSSRIASNIYSD